MPTHPRLETPAATSDGDLRTPREGGVFPPLLLLFSLCAITIAEPLLAWTRSHDPSVLLVATSRWKLVLAVPLLLLLPAPLALAIKWCRSRNPSIALGAYYLAVFTMLCLFALRCARWLNGVVDWWMVVPTALVAATGTLILFRLPRLDRFLRVLAVFLIAVPASYFAHPNIVDRLGRSAPSVLTGPSVVILAFDGLALSPLLEAGAGPSAELSIDTRRFPRLAELARTATWFRDAAAVSDLAELSLWALSTGRYPERARSLSELEQADTLFSRLHRYNTRASRSLVRFSAPARRPSSLTLDLAVALAQLHLPQGLSRYLPKPSSAWAVPASAARGGDRDVQEAGLVELLNGWDSKSPNLIVAHSSLALPPWQRMPDGSRYGFGITEFGRWPWGAELIEQDRLRYRLQLQSLDRQVGEVIDRLRDLGELDQCLLVVTSLGGLSFRPGGFPHVLTAENAGELLPIPLLLKLPGQKTAAVDNRPASLVDIAPTILDALGRPTGPEAEGVSLLGRSRALGRQGRRAIGAHLPDRDLAPGWALEQARSGRLSWQAGKRPGVVRSARSARSVRVHLRRPEDWSPEGGRPPVLMGRVSGAPGAPAPAQIAVLVEGEMVAMVRTVGLSSGDRWFTAVLEPVETSSPRVEIYAPISGASDNAPSDQRWSQVPEAGADCCFVEVLGDDGAELRLVHRGESVPIDQHEVSGVVEEILSGPREVEITGWALEPDRGRPPPQLLVYHRRALVYAGSAGEWPEGGVAAGRLVRYRLTIPALELPELDSAGLEVFGISSRGIASRLEVSYGLDPGPPAKVRLEDGSAVPLRAEPLGYVELIQAKADTVTLIGWSGDLELERPCRILLVFEGDRFVKVGFTGMVREDVARVVSVGLAEAGFFLEIGPQDELEDRTGAKVRVVAISERGFAAELARAVE